MKKLLSRLLLVIGLSLYSFQPLQANPDEKNLWIIGTWELKDNYPEERPTEWLEFLPSGMFINTQLNCDAYIGRYHLYEGDIYFAIEFNGEFLANGIRPNYEKNKLYYSKNSQLPYNSYRGSRYTSYEKVQGTRCVKG